MNMILILASILANCVGQLLMRKGMIVLGPVHINDLLKIISFAVGSVYIWISIMLYVVSIVIWMVVLSRVEVSYAYPMNSLGYVFVTISAYLFFGECLSIEKIIGILIICSGVFLISR